MQFLRLPLLFTFHIYKHKIYINVLYIKNSVTVLLSSPWRNFSLLTLIFYVMNLCKFYIFDLIPHTIKLFVTKFQYWIIRHYRRYVFTAAISETSDRVLLLKKNIYFLTKLSRMWSNGVFYFSLFHLFILYVLKEFKLETNRLSNYGLGIINGH